MFGGLEGRGSIGIWKKGASEKQSGVRDGERGGQRCRGDGGKWKPEENYSKLREKGDLEQRAAPIQDSMPRPLGQDLRLMLP